LAEDFILEMKGIVKQYPGVLALNGVDFKVRRNTIHCLVGENGAGKSTLIKILTCAERMTSGEILLDGSPFLGKNVRDAMDAGISTVFQELNIVNQLSVEDNLTLGREKHRCGIIRHDDGDPVLKLMAEFAPDIPLKCPVSQLSFAEKQIVETVKAIGTEAQLIIMDEPTASLSEQETARIYTFVKQLRAKGITVIYISHILDDIFTLGDDVTVLRDGDIIGTRKVAETSRDELIRMMIGRSVHGQYRDNPNKTAEVLLKADHLTTKAIHDVNFTLHKGEIIGFYGLRGAGKSEIARALFGLDRLQSGQIYVDGKPIQANSPGQALGHGIAMVPEERLTEGLFMKLPIADNIVITSIREQAFAGIVSEALKNSTAQGYIDRLNIKAQSCHQRAGTLSGGNQQKVVIAKYLNAHSKVLLLDEPTRGIDVGSKEEIYEIIRQLSSSDAGIIVFSSEYDEIASLCDRVILISGGKIVAEMSHQELDPQQIRRLTMGKGA
jgi:ribose transport system ATP-binding protein